MTVHHIKLTPSTLAKVRQNAIEHLPYAENDLKDFNAGLLVSSGRDFEEELSICKRIISDPVYLAERLDHWMQELPFLFATQQVEKARSALEGGANPMSRFDAQMYQYAKDLLPEIFLNHPASYSCIVMSAMLKNLELFSMALNFNADPYHEYLKLSVDKYGTIAAEFAAAYGFLEGLKELKNRGYELWPFPERAPELLAAKAINKESNAETFSYLLDTLGIQDIDKPFDGKERGPRAGITFLKLSEERDISIGITEAVLERGAKVDADFNPQQPKIIATDDFKSQIGDFFAVLSTRKQLNDIYDTLPLIRVTNQGDLARVALYLEYGANPLQRDKNGNTAIDAAKDKRRLFVKELEERANFKAITDLLEEETRKRTADNVTVLVPNKPGIDIEDF